MSTSRTIAGSGYRPFEGTGAILLVLFLVLVGLAASPELHHALHADANTPGHHCAISALLHGQIEPSVCEAPLCLAAVAWDHPGRLSLSVVEGTEELLPPGRGPPKVFS
ncbi:MAG TPA: hypothetical protein VN829_16750 [Dongiaceae bacterium]|nr:hypothetical protein [Dongiaceae bacterium]